MYYILSLASGVWILKERKTSLSTWNKVLLEKLVVP